MTTMANVPVPVKFNDVFSLLVSAFEGGSNYWYADLRYANGPVKDTPEKRALAEERGLSWDDLTNGLYRAAFLGGGLLASVPDYDDGPLHDITVARMEEALKLMAEQEPRHFADLMADNADADTGDVFLQLVVLGKVVFG